MRVSYKTFYLFLHIVLYSQHLQIAHILLYFMQHLHTLPSIYLQLLMLILTSFPRSKFSKRNDSCPLLKQV